MLFYLFFLNVYFLVVEELEHEILDPNEEGMDEKSALTVKHKPSKLERWNSMTSLKSKVCLIIFYC